MPRQGRALERVVAQIEDALSELPVTVESPEYIVGKLSGSRREVDVSVRGAIGSAEFLVIYECRDRADKQDVRWIEELATKAKDVGADKAVAVTGSQFTEGAERLAASLGIGLRRVEHLTGDEVVLGLAAVPVFINRLCGHIHNSVLCLPVDTDPGVEKLPSARLLHPKTGASVTLDQVLSPFKHDAFEGLRAGGPHVRKLITIDYPEPEQRLLLETTAGPIGVFRIKLMVELWIEADEPSISRFKRYLRGEDTLALTTEVEFEHRGSTVAFGIHEFPVRAPAMSFTVMKPTDE